MCLIKFLFFLIEQVFLMYLLCYFVLIVNLNKRLTLILREVNINGYNICILSIIGVVYLYIWGVFKLYDIKVQIIYQCFVYMLEFYQQRCIVKGEEYSKRIDFLVVIGYFFILILEFNQGVSNKIYLGKQIGV